MHESRKIAHLEQLCHQVLLTYISLQKTFVQLYHENGSIFSSINMEIFSFLQKADLLTLRKMSPSPA